MKVQKTENGDKTKITFVPETEEEKRLMGSLRQHFFWGVEENETFPKYAGITTENNFVTSLSFEYNKFQVIAEK